jgi:tetratricopeptide (TPR) repeat protein
MILAVVAVLALGALTGFAELIGRYRDEPMRAVTQRAGLVYMAINALAAVAAFAVIRAFDWRFGLADDASDTAVATMQVLVAGLAAAALFRTSLFTARIGGQDVGVGPSAVLDVLLRTVDRAVDRRRGIERLAVVAELPEGLSFEREAVALASYATASLQNLSLTEADAFGKKGSELRHNNDLDDDAKMRMFALDLMGLVGEAGLRAAIAQLARSAPEPPAEPAPSAPADEIAWTFEDQELVAPETPPPALPPPAIAPLPESNEELERVIERLEEVARKAPDLAEPRLAVGRAHAQKGWRELSSGGSAFWLKWALRPIGEALELRPTFADAHLEVGRIQTLRPEGRDEAEAHLRTALQYAEAPEMVAAVQFQLAVLNTVVEGRLEETARLLEECIATGTASPETRLASACVHVRLGDTALAAAQMEAAVEANAGHGPSRVLLGLIRDARGDIEGASQALADAIDLIDLEPGAGHAKDVGEGRGYHRLGSAAKAVETLAPELGQYLPGGEGLALRELTEDSPWRNLEEVATAVCEDVLVTHLGEPVIRAAPVTAPAESSASSATRG